MAVTDHLRVILVRDLDALIREIEAYPDEAQIWAQPPGVPNSAGTLALHMAGNLAHFVGAVLGETGYVRDREAEFGDRDVPRAEIIRKVAASRDTMDAVLRDLDPTRLDEPFPLELRVGTLNAGRFLLHLMTHLAYHLGQLDYHRRMVTGDSTSVEAQSMDALA